MMKHLGYSLVCLLAFASCQREADEVKPTQTPVAQTKVVGSPTAPDFVKTAVPDPVAAEFISGEFDGYPLNCTNNPWYGGAGKYYSSQDYGLLVLQDVQRNIQLNVSFNSTKLLSAAMPALWPQSTTSVYCQGFALDLYNVSPTNAVLALFHGTTWEGASGVKVQVTSISGNIVEGTFEGKLTELDSTGMRGTKVVTVKNGKFRIKTSILP